MTLTIVPKDAEALLTWPGLLDAFEAGHRLPKPDIKDLFVYRGPDTVLDRATWIDGLGALVKVATVIPSNAQRGLPTVNGSVTLYDDVTGQLTALVDFHLVTKWKTAGDSLLSARRLARKDAKNFLLVGAGTVAKSMVQAYSSLFPDARFTVWSRSRASAQAMGLPVADDLERAVKSADVICTATMATEPLIHGDWLQPGQHLDLMTAPVDGHHRRRADRRCGNGVNVLFIQRQVAKAAEAPGVVVELLAIADTQAAKAFKGPTRQVVLWSQRQPTAAPQLPGRRRVVRRAAGERLQT